MPILPFDFVAEVHAAMETLRRAEVLERRDPPPFRDPAKSGIPDDSPAFRIEERLKSALEAGQGAGSAIDERGE